MQYHDQTYQKAYLMIIKCNDSSKPVQLQLSAYSGISLYLKSDRSAIIYVFPVTFIFKYFDTSYFQKDLSFQKSKNPSQSFPRHKVKHIYKTLLCFDCNLLVHNGCNFRCHDKTTTQLIWNPTQQSESLFSRNESSCMIKSSFQESIFSIAPYK